MRSRWPLGDAVKWVAAYDQCNKCEEDVMQGNPHSFRFCNTEKVLAAQLYIMCGKGRGSAHILHGDDPMLYTTSKLMNESLLSPFLLRVMQIKYWKYVCRFSHGLRI